MFKVDQIVLFSLPSFIHSLQSEAQLNMVCIAKERLFLILSHCGPNATQKHSQLLLLAAGPWSRATETETWLLSYTQWKGIPKYVGSTVNTWSIKHVESYLHMHTWCESRRLDSQILQVKSCRSSDMRGWRHQCLSYHHTDEFNSLKEL